MANIPKFLKSFIASLSSVATSGKYSDLTGSPLLNAVATSGAYNDLSGIPVLGTAAARNVGTSTNNVIELDINDKLPSVDASQLFNVPGAIPKLYKVGLTLANNITNQNTQVDILPGVCKSVNNDWDLIFNTTQTIDITNTGNRGGALTPNTWYYVFIISNGTLTQGWFDSDKNAINKPIGYDYVRRIGTIKYDASSIRQAKFFEDGYTYWVLEYTQEYHAHSTLASNLLLDLPHIKCNVVLRMNTSNAAVNAYAYAHASIKDNIGGVILDTGANSVGYTSSSGEIPIMSADAIIYRAIGGNTWREYWMFVKGYKDYFVD